MRPINVTLDSQTWELAKQKSNFSAWVRMQLRIDADPHSLQAQLTTARKAIAHYIRLQEEQWNQEELE